MRELEDSTFIGERILEKRKQARMSRKALASMSGISVSSIRRFEGGLRTPRLDDVKMIAACLGIPAIELISERAANDAKETLDAVMPYVSNREPQELEDEFLEQAIEDQAYNKLCLAEDNADKAILQALAGISDEYFLNAIVEDFHLLNRRGKYEAYLRVQELVEANSYRFKDKME